MSRGDRADGGFTFIELLAVVSIIAVIVALLLPLLSGARESSRRTTCLNNLRQLAIGLNIYVDSHGVLPPGVVNETGPIRNEPLGYHFSWIVQSLPSLDQAELYGAFNHASGVYAASNLTGRRVILRTLLCPSEPGPRTGGDEVARTDYAGCHHDLEAPIAADNHGVFFLNSCLRYESLADGSSTTLFLGEKRRSGRDLGWASGTRATLRNTGSRINAGDLADVHVPDPARNSERGPSATPGTKGLEWVGGFGSQHPGGAHFVFGDGSIRFVRETIQPRVFQCLGNREDGEMIDASSY